MMKVYKCDNYEVVDTLLVIYNSVLVGEVDSITSFVKLTQLVNYNSIVCPELFTDVDGNKIKGLIHK
jgi:hypothetical protein